MTDLDDQLGVGKSGVKENPEKSKFRGRFTLSLSQSYEKVELQSWSWQINIFRKLAELEFMI